MSQRLHGCVNNVNLDAMHCEAYGARLQRKGRTAPLPVTKAAPSKFVQERSQSRSKLTVQNALMSKSKPNSVLMRQQPQSNTPSPPGSPISVIRKDLYPNNAAMVEVTVKTQKTKQQSRPNSLTRSHETWAKLLKNQSSRDNLSTFTIFDPLRTVHFLAKELQVKLLQRMPSDATLLQMVSDMQHALNRVPNELANASKMELENLTTKKTLPELKPTLETFDKEVYEKPDVSNKAVQTSRSSALLETEKLQQHLEESSMKIEAACKQMEIICNNLRTEKGELELLLKAEKETVKILKDKIEMLQKEHKNKEEESSTALKSATDEKNDLLVQVKKLKAQLENQQSAANQDLKNLIQDLRTKKTEAEQDAMYIRHQLTLAQMDKEKVSAILSIRERQITEIRDEMNQLQEVVNEQLVELKNLPYSSVHSSISNITDASVWQQAGKLKVTENGLVEDEPNKLQELFLEKNSLGLCKIVSENSSGTSTIIKDNQNNNNTVKEGGRKRSTTKNLTVKEADDNETDSVTTKGFDGVSSKQANIKDMFADIKKHAFFVGGNGLRSFPSQKALE